eukprot:PhF_6_TR39719/c1_g1_i1/m.59119
MAQEMNIALLKKDMDALHHYILKRKEQFEIAKQLQEVKRKAAAAEELSGKAKSQYDETVRQLEHAEAALASASEQEVAYNNASNTLTHQISAVRPLVMKTHRCMAQAVSVVDDFPTHAMSKIQAVVDRFCDLENTNGSVGADPSTKRRGGAIKSQ